MFNSLTYFLKSLFSIKWSTELLFMAIISALIAYFLYKKLHH